MSLQLTLLPFVPNESLTVIADSMLETDYDEELYKALMDLEKTEGEDCPTNLRTYVCREGGEVHYGTTIKTPYGERLRCLRVGELAQLEEMRGVDVGINAAVWAYLGHLNYAYRIALYWH